jgi:hypothetical protein
MTGLSVFAFLNVTVPYKGEIRQDAIPIDRIGFQTEGLFQFPSWHYYQVSGEKQTRFSSNATIIKND